MFRTPSTYVDCALTNSRDSYILGTDQQTLLIKLLSMTKIANGAAYFLVFIGFVLTVISVAGIWGAFPSGGVVTKSFESMGLIGFACIIVMAVESHSTKKALTPMEQVEANSSAENFGQLRGIATFLLIASVVVCVSLGLLSIWDIVAGNVLYQSVSSIATIGLYSFVTVLACKARENDLKGVISKAAVAATPVQPMQQAPVYQAPLVEAMPMMQQAPIQNPAPGALPPVV